MSPLRTMVVALVLIIASPQPSTSAPRKTRSNTTICVQTTRVEKIRGWFQEESFGKKTTQCDAGLCTTHFVTDMGLPELIVVGSRPPEVLLKGAPVTIHVLRETIPLTGELSGACRELTVLLDAEPSPELKLRGDSDAEERCRSTFVGPLRQLVGKVSEEVCGDYCYRQVTTPDGVDHLFSLFDLPAGTKVGDRVQVQYVSQRSYIPDGGACLLHFTRAVTIKKSR